MRNQLTYWLAAAVLAATLLSLTLTIPVQANPAKISAAARYGAEFGALASTGLSLSAYSAAESQPAVTAVAAAEANPPAPDSTPAPDHPPPPAPSPTPVPDKGKLIVIDPGHGGRDPGAVHTIAGGVVDLTEEEVNLWIALKLAEMLRADGYNVLLTRTDDRAVGPDRNQPADLQARVDVANRAGADIFVSVHHNGSDNRSIRGTTVYYCSHRPFADQNRRLARLTQQALVRNLRQAGYDTVDRGAQDDAFLGHLALLGPHNIRRPSQMPAVIGEALFITNDADADALKRVEIREAIARGDFEAIPAYFEEP